MAAYAGTTTLMFQTVMGNKRVSLLKVEVTNYNATGIPLTPLIAGLDNIEAVKCFVAGTLADAESPLQVIYDPATSACYCYHVVASQTADDTNIHTLGDIMILVIGT